MARPEMHAIRDRKLVILGLPWDVETDELKHYMSKFGELEDAIVMKDRVTGQSRGFGYATFFSAEEARKATAAQHVLNGRVLEVKVATPREEMGPSASRKINRIFVARIPSSVTDDMFRSYFQKYGVIMDAYMPKDVGSRTHRGIGFVTFESPDSVDKLMNETHELGGSTIAVDRATPKEETLKFWGKSFPDQYSFFNAYMAAAAAAAAQYGAFGPIGGSMEGYDQASYGFPGYMGMMGTENSGVPENAWDPVEGGVAKSSSPAGAPPAATSALGYASPSGVPAALLAAGYGYVTAQSGAPAPSTSAVAYGSDASHSSAPTAATTAEYGSTALNSNPHAVGTSASEYESSAPATVTPAAGYGDSAAYHSAPDSTFSASGYGSGSATYGGASDIPTGPGYGGVSDGSTALGYGGMGSYSGAPTAPTSTAGYASDATHSASAVQSYAAEYGSTGPNTGYGIGYGHSASYNGSSAPPTPGTGYGSGSSYSGAPTAPGPNTGYGSSASFSGAPTAPMHGAGYDSSASADGYGMGGPPASGIGNKIFIGRLPMEATTEHLRTYFSSFGRILDVYVPKDAKKKGHRGFGFVTFLEDGVAEKVSHQSHEILGQPIAVDRPTPQDSGSNVPYATNFSALSRPEGAVTWGGAPSLQRMGYGSLPAIDYFSGGWGSYAGGSVGPTGSGDVASGDRPSRADFRYKPY